MRLTQRLGGQNFPPHVAFLRKGPFALPQSLPLTSCVEQGRAPVSGRQEAGLRVEEVLVAPAAGEALPALVLKVGVGRSKDEVDATRSTNLLKAQSLIQLKVAG